MRFELKPFNRSAPDEQLLADLVAAAETLKAAGKSLTFRSYREVGKYAASTINDRFGSWNNALERAGLDLRELKNVPVDVLFDNLRLVWFAKGTQPVNRDMNAPPSQYSGSTYNARFGWRKALEDFVATVATEQKLLTTAETRHATKHADNRTKRDPSLSLRFLVLKRD